MQPITTLLLLAFFRQVLAAPAVYDSDYEARDVAMVQGDLIPLDADPSAETPPQLTARGIEDGDEDAVDSEVVARDLDELDEAIMNRLARRGNGGHGGGGGGYTKTSSRGGGGYGKNSNNGGGKNGKPDFSVVKNFGGKFNGIKKDGKAASLPPSLKQHGPPEKVKLTGNYKNDIKATKQEAKDHRQEANTAYKQGRLANKLDGKKYLGDKKFDTQANKQWSQFRTKDRLRDKQSTADQIAKIKKLEGGGDGGGGVHGGGNGGYGGKGGKTGGYGGHH